MFKPLRGYFKRFPHDDASVNVGLPAGLPLPFFTLPDKQAIASSQILMYPSIFVCSFLALMSIPSSARCVVCWATGTSRQRMPKGDMIEVDSPFKMPDADKRTGTQEPFVKLEMLTPQVQARNEIRVGMFSTIHRAMSTIFSTRQMPNIGTPHTQPIKGTRAQWQGQCGDLFAKKWYIQCLQSPSNGMCVSVVCQKTVINLINKTTCLTS